MGSWAQNSAESSQAIKNTLLRSSIYQRVPYCSQCNGSHKKVEPYETIQHGKDKCE